MLATMQEVPFSVGRILSYGSSVHSTTKVTTWRTGTAEETTFGAIGSRAAAFAHALNDTLDINADQRVGSLMYNCAEHLEVMFSVAAKGSVFVPLNMQLLEDQITYIINHSEMEVT